MILRRWREHAAARADLIEAALWYSGRELGLGDRFVDNAAAAVMSIRAWPDAAPSYRGLPHIPPLRRRSIDGFPFGIIYLPQGDEVVVVAYAHSRRRPGYWSERLHDL